jgi:hypothetical protein
MKRHVGQGLRQLVLLAIEELPRSMISDDLMERACCRAKGFFGRDAHVHLHPLARRPISRQDRTVEIATLRRRAIAASSSRTPKARQQKSIEGRPDLIIAKSTASWSRGDRAAASISSMKDGI